MTLLIATPVRGANPFAAQVSVGYSEFRAILCKQSDVDIWPAALTFGADNIRARNRIAAHVLQSMPQVDRVLWWDDDQWPYDTRIVKHMIDTGEDMIGAPYVTKEENPRPVYTDLGMPIDERGLMRLHNIGFGFTMTSRKCLELVSAGARRYYDTSTGLKTPNIFGLIYEMAYPRQATGDPEDETLLSEDLSFCSRWRAIGGKIWIDGTVGNMIAHAGTKVYDWRDLK